METIGILVAGSLFLIVAGWFISQFAKKNASGELPTPMSPRPIKWTSFHSRK